MVLDNNVGLYGSPNYKVICFPLIEFLSDISAIREHWVLVELTFKLDFRGLFRNIY